MITKTEIREMQREAGAASDTDMAVICEVALGEYAAENFEDAQQRSVAESYDRASAIEECERVKAEAIANGYQDGA